jgi:hypothetical protein
MDDVHRENDADAFTELATLVGPILSALLLLPPAPP